MGCFWSSSLQPQLGVKWFSSLHSHEELAWSAAFWWWISKCHENWLSVQAAEIDEEGILN